MRYEPKSEQIPVIAQANEHKKETKMAVYVEYDNQAFQIDKDIDLNTFAKSVIRHDEEAYFSKIKSVILEDGEPMFKPVKPSEINLDENDIKIKNIRGEWYGLDANNQQKPVLRTLMEMGKFDMALLKEDDAKAAYMTYKRDMGEDYTEEDFTKDVARSEAMYQMGVNSGNSFIYTNGRFEADEQEAKDNVLKQAINEDDDLKIQNKKTDTDQIAASDNNSLAKEIIKYAKGEGEYKGQNVWPFDRDISTRTADNMKLSSALVKELQHCNLKELKEMVKELKRKNAELTEMIRQQQIEKIQNELAYNKETTLDNKEDLNISSEFKDDDKQAQTPENAAEQENSEQNSKTDEDREQNAASDSANEQSEAAKEADKASEIIQNTDENEKINALNNEATKDGLGDMDDAYEERVRAENATLQSQNGDLRAANDPEQFIPENRESTQNNQMPLSQNTELRSENIELNNELNRTQDIDPVDTYDPNDSSAMDMFRSEYEAQHPNTQTDTAADIDDTKHKHKNRPRKF